MSNRSMSRTAFVGIVAFVAVMLTIAAQAPAVAGEPGLEQRVITRQQIFDKVNTGESLSPAEVRFVKSTDLAALLPDPSQVETGMIVKRVPVVLQWALAGDISAISPMARSRTRCNTTEKWWRQKSFLGSTIYRMHHQWRTCWNGLKVTKVDGRQTWFDQTDFVFYDRGASSDWYSGVWTTRAQTFTQHHIEYCVVRYGCYYSGYPWIRAYRYGSGHHSWYHGV